MILKELIEQPLGFKVSIKTESLQNVDVKDNAQINIVNARETISVAIASVHVIVEKDARTEILNFVTEINSLIQYFYSSEINGLPI